MSALGCVCSRGDDFSPVTVRGARGDWAEIEIASLNIWSGKPHSESLRSCNQDCNVSAPLWITTGCNLLLFCHTEVDYEGHNRSMAYLLKVTEKVALGEYTDQDDNMYLC